MDFKVIVEPKDIQSFTVILVASSRQEKSAWTSDISQACPDTSLHPLSLLLDLCHPAYDELGVASPSFVC